MPQNFAAIRRSRDGTVFHRRSLGRETLGGRLFQRGAPAPTDVVVHWAGKHLAGGFFIAEQQRRLTSSFIGQGNTWRAVFSSRSRRDRGDNAENAWGLWPQRRRDTGNG